MTTWHYQMTITPNSEHIGQSIKAVLIHWLIPQRIRGALRLKQHVRINGLYRPTNYQLQANDQLSLVFDQADFRTGESQYPANNSHALDIIFENDDLVVVNKPAGMKMHPHSPSETDTLLNFLAANFSKRHLYSAGAIAKPYMVHRIDRETSGAVIVAKNPVVVPILNRMLKEKVIQRTYLAWVQGILLKNSGTIDRPIGRDISKPFQRQVNGVQAQHAKTHWFKMHTVFQNTLLRLQLDTGRMHQIRVHLASINHPIVGDSLYGQRLNQQRMMLHAMSLTLPLPFDGPKRIITTSLPSDFPKQLYV